MGWPEAMTVSVSAISFAGIIIAFFIYASK